MSFHSKFTRKKNYTVDTTNNNVENNFIYNSSFDGATIYTKTINNHESWIRTFSGRSFDPISPKLEDIVIEDIAHSLSMQCRFLGHSSSFYSIAQHSILVSYLCDYKDRLSGLLHDASEAYIVDVPTPIKHSGSMEYYIEIENILQNTIYKKYGLLEKHPESVLYADSLMLATEGFTFMPNFPKTLQPAPISIQPLSPSESENLFLNRFRELYVR